MRIAVLMLIHQYSDQQKRLLTHLAKDFEVFVHIDRRTGIRKNDISIPNVHVSKKYKVYWGSYNQIRAILHLITESNKKRFDRYILISGDDIPVKSNKKIQAYFENNPNEYFDFHELPTAFWADNGGYDRIDFFHPNSLSRGPTNKVQRFLNRGLNKINREFVMPYMKNKHLRRRLEVKYYGGASWFDITHAGSDIIIAFLKNNRKYLRKFRFTLCADEIFFHTIVANSPDLRLVNKCNRYIDWETGPEAPRVLRLSDYSRVMNSDGVFARKVSLVVDSEIIEKIYADIAE